MTSSSCYIKNNRDNMEELIRQSTLLRDMIETDIQNTANDLEAQRLAVNYAFRNRIHEVRLGLARGIFAFFGTKSLSLRPTRVWDGS